MLRKKSIKIFSLYYKGFEIYKQKNVLLERKFLLNAPNSAQQCLHLAMSVLKLAGNRYVMAH